MESDHHKHFRGETILKQVAFDKSVQRHLGSTLYVERVKRYKTEMALGEDNYNFSEKDLVKYFRGESREMKRYILDSLRDWVTHNPENKLKEYVEFSGKSKDRPLSYSSLEKTFYSLFIFQDVLETPIGYNFEVGSKGSRSVLLFAFRSLRLLLRAGASVTEKGSRDVHKAERGVFLLT